MKCPKCGASVPDLPNDAEYDERLCSWCYEEWCDAGAVMPTPTSQDKTKWIIWKLVRDSKPWYAKKLYDNDKVAIDKVTNWYLGGMGDDKSDKSDKSDERVGLLWRSEFEMFEDMATGDMVLEIGGSHVNIPMV